MNHVGDWREDALIDTFIRPMAESIDDDCALLAPQAKGQMISTDSAVEDVHFRRDWPAQDVAYKQVLATLSDVVASAAQPQSILLSLHLPNDLAVEWLAAFCSGFKRALDHTGVRLIGGNLSRANQIVIVTTASGPLFGSPIFRSGARPGDLIGVTGRPGLAASQLAALLDKSAPASADRYFQPPFYAHLVKDWVNCGGITAMMDLSDGLPVDLERLCKASQVGAHVVLDPLLLQAKGEDLDTWFRGGEDYELLCAVSPSAWDQLAHIAQSHQVPFHNIGHFQAAGGLHFSLKNELYRFKSESFSHFKP
ncbi:MAG: thiamine-phosphate kinase [Acidobacteria bacterium]|nr:thiamine-phosphate kinase [Acidobacteriota bacterium]MCB9397162.1 thiamine-phosphate kinase [Acidobacteriota bacterium]